MVKKRLLLLPMWCLVVTYKASRAPLEPAWLSWLLLVWTVPSLVKSLTGAPAFAPALHSPTLCWWSWAVLAHARPGLRECKQAVTHLSHSTFVSPGYEAMSFTRLPWSLKFAAETCNEACECTACGPEPSSRGASMKRAERRALLPWAL